MLNLFLNLSNSTVLWTSLDHTSDEHVLDPSYLNHTADECILEPGLPELRMRTTNESERILENLCKNEWIRIRANLGETGQKPGEFGQKMGKKRANETETWQNSAKPKVSGIPD